MMECRTKGLPVRGAVDCLIAELALENDAVLLHCDADFDRIALVRPLRCWGGGGSGPLGQAATKG